MAARMNNNNITTMRRSDLPARMAGRTAEVIPVGAWVQPESLEKHQTYEAVISAAEEEARLRALHEEKERRLRQFQADVKQRVLRLAKLKKEQQLAQSYKAVEVERKVLCQSAFAAERSTPRKNRCMQRDDSMLAIRHSGTLNTQGGIVSESEAEEERAKAFQEQSKQIHQFTRAARRKLMSKRIMTEDFIKDDLPGGVWKTGATLDHPISRSTCQSDIIDLQGEEKPEYTEEPPETENMTLAKVVHFDPDPPRAETRKDRITRKSAPTICGSDVSRVLSVPTIYPGVTCVEEKQREVAQRAMYRRLFMDIEREQVKENQRASQHRKKIVQLKREKEEARRQQELESREKVEPRDPVTGETVGEILEREQEEKEASRQIQEERRQAAQRSVEAERYVEALKAMLREKIVKQNIDLPPLCCCGPTVWDTSPQTCANNCVFYRNPKAYTRALQSLLASCDMA